MDSIARIPDSIKQSLYIKRCAEIMDVDEHILVDETHSRARALLKNKRHKQFQEETRESDQSYRERKKTHAKQSSGPTANAEISIERDLVRLLVTKANYNYQEEPEILLGQFILEALKQYRGNFVHPVYGRIIEDYFQSLDTLQFPDEKHYINLQDDELREAVISVLTSPYEYSQNWENMFRIYLNQETPDENYRVEAQLLTLRYQLQKTQKLILENKKIMEDLQSDGGEGELENKLRVHMFLLQERAKLIDQLGMITVS